MISLEKEKKRKKEDAQNLQFGIYNLSYWRLIVFFFFFWPLIYLIFLTEYEIHILCNKQNIKEGKKEATKQVVHCVYRVLQNIKWKEKTTMSGTVTN